MGYIAQVACHIRGNREAFFNIQEEYFKRLDKTDDLRFDTSCITKEEYLACGQRLWHAFFFNPVENNKVDGKFIENEIKWYNFYHQWKILSEVFTQFEFSWYYLHSGKDDDDNDDIELESNQELIKNFDPATMNYFSISGSRIQPAEITVFE